MAKATAEATADPYGMTTKGQTTATTTTAATTTTRAKGNGNG
jgi:hypothetical protein